jgi:hypothetical protein
MASTIESIPIPAARIPGIAIDKASSSKVTAGILVFVCAICALAMAGTLTDSRKQRNTSQALGAVIAGLLVVGVPALFAIRALRNAQRATRACNVAKTDPGYTWRLSGKQLIAADPAGAPRPELSFKLNGKLRTMLLAMEPSERPPS